MHNKTIFVDYTVDFFKIIFRFTKNKRRKNVQKKKKQPCCEV